MRTDPWVWVRFVAFAMAFFYEKKNRIDEGGGGCSPSRYFVLMTSFELSVFCEKGGISD